MPRRHLRVCWLALAEPKYGPGTSDTEIRIGNTAPYSGPASAYGTGARAMKAVFDRVNAEQGGVNGRKIVLLSLDDAYNPSRTVERVRELVEKEEVSFIAYPIGTAQNAAIQRYLNTKKVPQIFVGSGANQWGDYKRFPWTTAGVIPSYDLEGYAYGQHIGKTNPDAKIGILYQSDDLGKDYLKGFLAGLGEKGKAMIVAELPYQITDPTVDSQVVSLKGSGANVVAIFALPKATAQTIRKIAELDWKPVQYVAGVSSSVGSVMNQAGLANAQGVIAALYAKDPTDPAVRETPAYKDYEKTLATYYPGGNPQETINVNGYNAGMAVLNMLRQAGDDLTRDGIMKAATSLEFELPMMIEGIKLSTSPTNHTLMSQIHLGQLEGQHYKLIGGLVSR
ncbi:ABC transporter substrate-binding protein [Bradyrhizobium sp. DASA03030]|uniref:ABC transporter substrate-binding protein n=1 Tax=Bradyrhizobium sp. SPXBL-04 TaxID=3395914 RepID=UPI003F6F2808